MIRVKMSIVMLICGFFIGPGLLGCSIHSSADKKIASTNQAGMKDDDAGQTDESKNEDWKYYYTVPERECTRAMLKEATESYIAAQEAGDLSKMVLASDAKFKENFNEVTKDKGLWNTPLPVAFHRSIYDIARCKTFTEVIVTEGEHPYVVGTRLTVDNGKVVEIDSIVTDKSDWKFDADEFLKYSSVEDWPVLHVDDRVSRQELVDAANQYFDFLYMDKGIRPPWGTPCARLEGGEIYTNKENEHKDTCRKFDILGKLVISERTFVVDEEMGTVNIFCRYGDSGEGWPDSHTFRLVDGKYRWIHTLTVDPTNATKDVPKYVPEPDCECDRDMLRAATESYIAAQEAGDLSKMSLADKVKFMENMSEIDKEKGLWNTPLPVAHHLSIYDVGRCKTFTEVIVTEGGHKYVIGTRLEVDKGKVKEINSLVTDKDDWYFDADDYLKFSKAEDWRVLPVDERVDREELINAGHQYFDFLFADQSISPPWGTPCARLEGGDLYTNRDNEYKDTCKKDKPISDIFINDRTFVVDEEMGSVNVFCRFGDSKDGMPDSHLFRLVNGKYRWIHTLSVNISGEPLVYP